MQRALAISLSFIILISSVGLVINKHYCGNHLESISLNLSEDDVCCCGPVEAVTNCCKNERVVAKLEQDKVPPSIQLKVSPIVAVIQTIKTNLFFSNDQDSTSGFVLINSPPLPEKLYSLYSSFIFYG